MRMPSMCDMRSLSAIIFSASLMEGGREGAVFPVVAFVQMVLWYFLRDHAWASLTEGQHNDAHQSAF